MKPPQYSFISIFSRNLSQGSSDTGFFGSMEKEKRRREALGEGRVDAEAVISELLEGVDLDKAVQEADDAESKTQRFQDIAYFKCSRLIDFSLLN